MIKPIGMEAKIIQKCPKIDGSHEWQFSPLLGDVCKHCGFVREGLPVKPTRKPKVKVVVNPTPEQGETKETPLSNSILNKILAESNSRAAVVITFCEPILREPLVIRQFNISAVNVNMSEVATVLKNVQAALSGQLPGNLNIKTEDKPCEVCGGDGYYVEDYNDPQDPHGHGQREIPCPKCRPPKDEKESDPDR
jgi:hypothetical protein